MRATEYAAAILQLVAEHGDLEVEKWMPAKGRHTAPAPVLAFKRQYTRAVDLEKQGGSFYHHTDNPVQKGDPVFRV